MTLVLKRTGLLYQPLSRHICRSLLFLLVCANSFWLVVACGGECDLLLVPSVFLYIRDAETDQSLCDAQVLASHPKVGTIDLAPYTFSNPNANTPECYWEIDGNLTGDFDFVVVHPGYARQTFALHVRKDSCGNPVTETMEIGLRSD